MLQLLVGRRSADEKGAKQPLQITKAVDVPAKGSPSLGFWHTRLCSQPLEGVQRGTRQLKGVKGVIVLLEGQASSCWHAKLPPFVLRAKPERTGDPGGDELLSLLLGERGDRTFHPLQPFRKWISPVG